MLRVILKHFIKEMVDFDGELRKIWHEWFGSPQKWWNDELLSNKWFIQFWIQMEKDMINDILEELHTSVI